MCVYVNKHGAWDANTLVYMSPSVNITAWYNISVQLDGTLSIPEIYTFEVLDNPMIKSFENGKKTYAGEVLVILVKLHIIIIIIIIVVVVVTI